MRHKLMMAAAVVGLALLVVFVDRKTGFFSKLYDKTVGRVLSAGA